MKRVLGMMAIAAAAQSATAFVAPAGPQHLQQTCSASSNINSSSRGPRCWRAAAEEGDSSSGGGNRPAVKDMRVSEIKAELDLRGVSYADVFEKADLVQRLEDSRARGRADPSIVDRFNKDMLESRMDPELRESVRNMDAEQLKDIAASDGSLPGGMTPELLQKLTSNPELMVMLQNPKLQEVMKSVMQDGPSGAAKFFGDPEAQEILQKLSSIMQS